MNKFPVEINHPYISLAIFNRENNFFMVTVAEEFIEQAVFRMEENTPRIEKCIAMLDEAALWYKPNKSSNSIANLILHLCGNITQYIISSLGGKPDDRHRDEEFAVDGGYNKEELLAKLKSTVATAVNIIKHIEKEELLRERNVQGYNLTGIGIITHVVEHYSYHTGQIALLTKLKVNNDLGFYAGVDLNVKNSESLPKN